MLRLSPFRVLAASRKFTVGAALNSNSNIQPVDDPVKKLFLDKLKEYQTKTIGGKIVVNAESDKGLAEELARLKRIYGEGDLSKFPKFEFKDV